MAWRAPAAIPCDRKGAPAQNWGYIGRIVVAYMGGVDPPPKGVRVAQELRRVPPREGGRHSPYAATILVYVPQCAAGQSAAATQ